MAASSFNKLDWDKKMKVEQVRTLMRQLPPKIGNLAERHFKDSFRNKGWMDKGMQLWPARKNAGRGSLMVVSGALKRSVRRAVTTHNSVVIVAGDDKVPYAQIHNEGGTTHPTVTERMRRYAWARHAGAGSPGQAAAWKGVALTKKQKLDVRIPRRKFMGQSASLDRKTVNMIRKELNTIFK